MNSKSKWCPIRVKQSLVSEQSIHSYQVFVGGILPSVSDESLHSHFEQQFGPVAAAKVLRFPDGRSRGFGFVKFVGEEHYNNALEKKKTILEGGEVECRPSVAREMAEGDGKQLLKSKIILFGLDKNISEVQIQEYFNMYGEIVRVKKFQCAEDRYPSHIYQGYVQFRDDKSVKRLLQFSVDPRFFYMQPYVVLIYCATATCMQAKTWKDEYLRKLEVGAVPQNELQLHGSLLLYQESSSHGIKNNPHKDHQKTELTKAISCSTREISGAYEQESLESIRFNVSRALGSHQCRVFFSLDLTIEPSQKQKSKLPISKKTKANPLVRL
jgi:RNA recognition motif-containing protein